MKRVRDWDDNRIWNETKRVKVKSDTSTFINISRNAQFQCKYWKIVTYMTSVSLLKHRLHWKWSHGSIEDDWYTDLYWFSIYISVIVSISASPALQWSTEVAHLQAPRLINILKMKTTEYTCQLCKLLLSNFCFLCCA